jgi:hypothetical protein
VNRINAQSTDVSLLFKSHVLINLRRYTMKTKKEYSKPQLTVHGSVEKITQGPGRGWIDALFGAQGGWRPPYGGGGTGS